MKINGIDEKDNQIINLLLEDSRMSYSDIGDRIGMSRTAVKKRISELEKSGLIKGYTVVLDPQSSPSMMTFITTIETEPNAFNEVAEVLKNEKCVVTLCQISGDSAMHAVCVAESIEEMRSFAKKIRTNCPGLKRLQACNVWEVMKGSVLSE